MGAGRYELGDAQWKRIEGLLPGRIDTVRASVIRQLSEADAPALPSTRHFVVLVPNRFIAKIYPYMGIGIDVRCLAEVFSY